MKYFGLLLLLITLTSSAQHVQTVRGTILDKDSKTPLIGANVIITDLEPIKGAASDFNGHFKITGVPVGRHNIKISYVGYEPKTYPNIEVTSGKELILNIELSESIMMDEVLIEAQHEKEKTVNKMASVSARTFSIEETSRYAGSLNDVARMAQNFAGVQGSDDSRNDIVIRGNSPTGVLYRLEDVDIPNPNHFALMGTTGGPVSMLNNNVLDNSDFMTGAFPSEYGNALAGVFDLHIRNGNNEKHEFLGQLGFNGLEMMAEGPINKEKFSSYMINGRYSTLELFSLMGLEIGVGSAVPQYQDISFKANFPNKKGKTVIWGIGGTSNVEFLESQQEVGDNLFSEGGEDLYFNSKIGVAAISNTYRFSEKTFLKSTLAIDATYNKAQNDTVNPNDQIFYHFYGSESTEGKQSLNFTLNHKINARHLLKIGVYNQRRFFNLRDSVHVRPYNLAIPGGTITIPEHWRSLTNSKGSTYFIQPFAQWQYRINKAITFNGGVHTQYFLYNNDFTFEPRAGLTYELNPKNKLSLGYGVHNQLAPTRLFFKQVDDDFGNPVLDSEGNPLIPNKDLGMTRSQHYVLSYDHSIGSNTRFKSEFYYQSLDNVPVHVQSNSYSILNFGANFDLAFPDTLQNTGTGTNYGMEFTLEKFLDKGFYYLLTASLYESKYVGSDDIERNSTFNGNYTFNLLIGKEFWFGAKEKEAENNSSLVVDAKVTLNGGQRFVPIDIAASQTAGKTIYDWDRAYENRLPNYFRSDLKIGYKRNGKNITQEWALNFQNLTNHKNVFYKTFDAETGNEKTFYQNGFLPIMQYKILF